jgi:chromosome transmission fidelity protein 8
MIIRVFFYNLILTSKGVPILIIGHHVLHGKVVNLDKPLLVMRKTRENRETLNDEEMSEDCEQSQQNLTQYLVKAVVRKKLLFNKRPRPIVEECKKLKL